MKRFCKSIFATIIILILSVIGLRIYTYNNTSTAAAVIDRLNPFVKNDTLYTKTTAKYEGKYPDAVSKIENFTYIQTCYNKNGYTRKLEYISFGKQLSPGKFLKLEVKGQNVLYWEEIKQQELPESVVPLL
ncbi:hypothetical protein A5819_001530 [Enterococcus sp. 7E2_DIV0204]|uniref:YxeA family protein n=1 Tax=unclassified Enterococcus TaxID=2608891 RepID=UPI000A334D4E|nr:MULTISPECIES: YxeA family protein [unclassified Enterococcus]OTN89038.1 hypothetical protein A5819_001530 [Enterococcus sp. 7E2_DIV0204]OTP51494.1 hypothetical protein A5884_000689 [Enterococcus sp. 7D2_DIV0200]